MDFRISAFLGPVGVLGAWRRDIPSAVVVPLTKDLGLTPVSGGFLDEVRTKLDATSQPEQEVIRLWGAQASKGCTIAYIWADSREDFYIDGVQYALAWVNEKAVPSELCINGALRLVGVHAKEGEREFVTVDLGRYPDTESWAAAAIVGEAARRKPGGWRTLIEMLKDRGQGDVEIAVRRDAATALGEQPLAAETITALAGTPLRRARTDIFTGRVVEAGISAVCMTVGS